MGWRQTALAAAGALLLPGASAALDLGGGLGTSVDYDSNVVRIEDSGTTDDWIFRVTPIVQLIEDRGKAQWRIDYRFPYEIAVDTRSGPCRFIGIGPTPVLCGSLWSAT